MKRCNYCGSENEDDAVGCRGCGETEFKEAIARENSRRPINPRPTRPLLRPTGKNILIFPLLIIFGGLLSGLGAYFLWMGVRCEHWPTAPGVIRASRMNLQVTAKGSRNYSASLCYDYQVAGAKYFGSELAFGDGSFFSKSEARAQEVLNRYPAGARVLVHYAPDDPATAVLETGIHGGAWGLCFGGIVLLLAGCLVLKSLLAPSPAYPALRQRSAKWVGCLLGVTISLLGAFFCFASLAGVHMEGAAFLGGALLFLFGLFYLRLLYSMPR